MSAPVDPLRTTTAQGARDAAPITPDATATAPTPVGADAPGFGPAVEPGEVGTLGPYRVVRELGKGGMGAVYLAIDTRLNRKLALKVILSEFAADAAAKERFLREARAVAQITQDNVVTVYEADERDGVPYIAMQFLQGCPLDEFLKKRGAPALPHIVRIAREAALGLAAAHQMGLVHRDIKPANLWLEAPSGRVKVLDFGLAKPVGTDSELTKSGALVGTPAYMSPEQARGLKVDHRTDLFSLGGVLYRLCTGRTPFAGDHVMAVLAAVLTDEPTPVRELNPNVPEPLAVLIHQLLAKKPEDRPQSANEVARNLWTILDSRPAPNAAGVPNGGGTGTVSNTAPAVVHAVPMEMTVRPNDVFADLGATEDEDATEAEAAAPRPERKTGGKGLLLAAGAALLLAVIAVVVSQSGKKPEPEAKNPDAGAPGANKEKPKLNDTKDPKVPADALPSTHKNGVGMEFVKVPKGTGWLGGGGGRQGDKKVEFKDDYYIGKYEVTQEEWEKVTGLNPSEFKRGNEVVKDIPDADLKRFPVESVTWNDCQLFVERLNKKEAGSGWVYRLPTTDEWEYACRGGPVDKLDSAFDFYVAKPTNALLPDHANFNPLNDRWLKRTCKVGSYQSNSIGIHDAHGNVLEWCDDTFTIADGVLHRTYRGGCWDHNADSCRAWVPGTSPATYSHFNLGLRVVRVPAGK